MSLKMEPGANRHRFFHCLMLDSEIEFFYNFNY